MGMSARVGGYQRLGMVTLLGVLSLIALGATVRVTDSGLACPDWPLCDGRVIPRGDYHVWIEWTHRLVASVVGVVILGFVVVTWLRYRERPWVVWPVTAALVVLGVQVVLGGLTVTEDLPVQIVTAHLGVALMIVLLLTLGLLASFVRAGERGWARPGGGREGGGAGTAWTGRTVRLAAVTAVGMLSLVLLGAYVSGTDAGFACSGWPLCNDSVVPEGRLAGIQVAHRYLAAFVGLLVVGLVVSAWAGRREQRALLGLSLVVAGLFVAQVMVGAANIWTTLADGWRVSHVVLASWLWTSLVVLVAVGTYRVGWVPGVGMQRPLPSLLTRSRVKAQGGGSGD